MYAHNTYICIHVSNMYVIIRTQPGQNVLRRGDMLATHVFHPIEPRHSGQN